MSGKPARKPFVKCESPGCSRRIYEDEVNAQGVQHTYCKFCRREVPRPKRRMVWSRSLNR